MDSTTLEAIQILARYGRGYFDIYDLCGDDNKRVRQVLMSGLMGTKLPIAKCGVTAIRAEFYKRLNPQGECMASKDAHFAELCKAALANVAA